MFFIFFSLAVKHRVSDYLQIDGKHTVWIDRSNCFWFVWMMLLRISFVDQWSCFFRRMNIFSRQRTTLSFAIATRRDCHKYRNASQFLWLPVDSPHAAVIWRRNKRWHYNNSRHNKYAIGWAFVLEMQEEDSQMGNVRRRHWNKRKKRSRINNNYIA